MNKYYLGIDAGTISVKGVIIDEYNNIIASKYLYIEEDIIKTTKKLISILNKKIKKLEYKIVSVGTTGVARKLIGTMLETNVIKNEIISHTIGITTIKPNIRTIIDIGGQGIKIMELNNNALTNYNIYDLYTLDCSNKKEVANRICDNLTDILNNKKIIGPISLQGGYSKNIDINKKIKKLIKDNIYIDKNSLFQGALGVAILSKNIKEENDFDIFSKIKKFEVLNEKESL